MGSVLRLVGGVSALAIVAACGGGGGGGGSGNQQLSDNIIFGQIGGPGFDELNSTEKSSRTRLVDGTVNSETGDVLQAYTLDQFYRKAVAENRISFRYRSPNGATASDSLVFFASEFSQTSQDGVTFFQGQKVKTDNTPGRVDTRDFTVREARQTDSLFGVLDVTEAKPEYGTYQNLTAYTAGGTVVDPGTIVSTDANYTGGFIGVIALGAAGTTAAAGDTLYIFGDLDLDVDFAGDDVTGTITFNQSELDSLGISGGSLSSDGFTADVTVVSSGSGDFAISNGATGATDGQFYLGGEEAVGTLQVIDGTTILTGAYGGATGN